MNPLGPENPEDPPTGNDPATVKTPAPFVQYVPPPCKQGLPVCVNAIVSLPVNVPEYTNDAPLELVPGIVSVDEGN